MSNWEYAQIVPTDVWRNAMTLPRKLSLKNTSKGVRMFTTAVKETERLRTGVKNSFDKKVIKSSMDFATKIEFKPSMIEMELELGLSKNPPSNLGLALSNSKGEVYKIGFDVTQNQFYSDRTKAGKTAFSDKFAAKVHTAPRLSDNETLKLHLFFDVGSVELFADDGAIVMSELFFPNEDFTQLQLYVEGGEVELLDAHIYELKNIWRNEMTANP